MQDDLTNEIARVLVETQAATVENRALALLPLIAREVAMRPEWTPIDPDNPPATHMVVIYNDGSGAQVLTKFDNHPNYFMAEDGWEIEPKDLSKDYSWWAPAPEGFVPHFMEVTDADYY